MANIFTSDFTGSNGAGWGSNWESYVAGSGVVDIQSNKGRNYTPNTANAYAVSFSNYSTHGTQSTSEMLVTVTKDSESRPYTLHVGLQGTGLGAGSSGNFTLASGAWVEIPGNASTGMVLYSKKSGGSQVDRSNSAVSNYSFANNTSHKIRMRIQNSTLYFKIWAAGDNEPSSWTREVALSTDTPGAGQSWLGIHNPASGSGIGAINNVYYDDVTYTDGTATVTLSGVGSMDSTADGLDATVVGRTPENVAADIMDASAESIDVTVSAVSNALTGPPMDATAEMLDGTVSFAKHNWVTGTVCEAAAEMRSAHGGPGIVLDLRHWFLKKSGATSYVPLNAGTPYEEVSYGRWANSTIATNPYDPDTDPIKWYKHQSMQELEVSFYDIPTNQIPTYRKASALMGEGGVYVTRPVYIRQVNTPRVASAIDLSQPGTDTRSGYLTIHDPRTNRVVNGPGDMPPVLISDPAEFGNPQMAIRSHQHAAEWFGGGESGFTPVIYNSWLFRDDAIIVADPQKWEHYKLRAGTVQIERPIDVDEAGTQNETLSFWARLPVGTVTNEAYTWAGETGITYPFPQSPPGYAVPIDAMTLRLGSTTVYEPSRYSGGEPLTYSWPTSTFEAIINRGTVNEERILVQSRTGTDMTIAQRGYGGTVARNHPIPSTVEFKVYDLMQENGQDPASLGNVLDEAGYPVTTVKDLRGNATTGNVPWSYTVYMDPTFHIVVSARQRDTGVSDGSKLAVRVMRHKMPDEMTDIAVDDYVYNTEIGNYGPRFYPDSYGYMTNPREMWVGFNGATNTIPNTNGVDDALIDAYEVCTGLINFDAGQNLEDSDPTSAEGRGVLITMTYDADTSTINFYANNSHIGSFVTPDGRFNFGMIPAEVIGKTSGIASDVPPLSATQLPRRSDGEPRTSIYPVGDPGSVLPINNVAGYGIVGATTPKMGANETDREALIRWWAQEQHRRGWVSAGNPVQVHHIGTWDRVLQPLEIQEQWLVGAFGYANLTISADPAESTASFTSSISVPADSMNSTADMPQGSIGAPSVGASVTASAAMLASGNMPQDHFVQAIINYAGGMYAPVVLADGPTAYYRMSDTAAIMVDELGAYTGSYVGTIYHGVAPMPADAGFDTAVELKGSGHGEAPVPAIFNDKVGTVELWFKMNLPIPAGLATIMQRRNGSQNDLFIGVRGTGQPNTGQMEIVNGWSDTILSDVTVDDGDWHHLVVTFDGTFMTLWIDGVVAGSVLMTYTQQFNIPIWIGDTPFPGAAPVAWDGKLDEIAFYNRVLTAPEIAEHTLYGGDRGVTISVATMQGSAEFGNSFFGNHKTVAADPMDIATGEGLDVTVSTEKSPIVSEGPMLATAESIEQWGPGRPANFIGTCWTASAEMLNAGRHVGIAATPFTAVADFRGDGLALEEQRVYLYLATNTAELYLIGGE